MTSFAPAAAKQVKAEIVQEKQEQSLLVYRPIESEVLAPVVEISDNDDDDEASDESVEAEDRIFCEFTKIQRTRNKYKCEFKNAIVHIKGRDFVLKQMTGDIEY